MFFLKNINSIIDHIYSLGLTKEIAENAVNDWYVLHFSFENNKVERIDYETADDCFIQFQNLCIGYDTMSRISGLEVYFPNEEWNELYEEPSGYGNIIIVKKGEIITDYFEIVNPEYYE